MRSEQLISKKTLVMSVVFHLLVAFSFSIAWPFIASPPITAQPLVIVNMVDRVPETNLEAAKSKAPKKPRMLNRKQQKSVHHRRRLHTAAAAKAGAQGQAT